MYQTLDPTTEELLETFPTASDREIEQTLTHSLSAFKHWRQQQVQERTKPLLAIADELENQAEPLAQLMATEMGKPFQEGVAEAHKCAWVCRYYAEMAPEFLANHAIETDASQSFVRLQPLGPILAIMPWNFPFWQVFRFAAPALAAGNTVILKHAPNTPRCALAITQLVQGHLDHTGVFQNLFLSNQQAESVILDDRVRGVTLTGSTRAGQTVAAIAGRALKPMVMELGGSDPLIVLNDADIDQAAQVGAASRCLNNGQSCIAAKRFIVQAKVYDCFVKALDQQMSSRTMGDPRLGFTLGPLARKDLADHLSQQVDRAMAAGGRLISTSTPPPKHGFFHPAMVLAELDPYSDIAAEEFFGPVALVFRFEQLDQAIQIANATPFGLGASLWTSDQRHADRFIDQLDSGAVFINGMVKSDPRLPFGGVKQSGFGRELARAGMLEFVNQKTIWRA